MEYFFWNAERDLSQDESSESWRAFSCPPPQQPPPRRPVDWEIVKQRSVGSSRIENGFSDARIVAGDFFWKSVEMCNGWDFEKSIPFFVACRR